MRRFAAHLAAGLLTFLVGVGAVIWLARTSPVGCTGAPAAHGKPARVSPAAETTGRPAEAQEAKAVRAAEEFVARNGYTDLPADENALAYETIEWSSDVGEMLESRRDTLERRAYGFRRGRKRAGQAGWTVVFRYTKRLGNSTRGTGRAVTMDENFQNLRVEHVDFILAGVEKKL